MTSIETGPSWVERLNPRHWTLVWKLVIVGLVPALLALTLGVLRIADQAGSAADLGRSGRLLEARNQIVVASSALRTERDQATLFAAGNGIGDRAALDSSRQRADDALKAMQSDLTSANTDLEPSTQAALQRTQDSLDLIPSLRQAVTATPAAPYDQVVNRYTNVIGTIDVLDRSILRQQRTPETAGLADASSAVSGALEQLSIQHAIIAGAIRAGKPLPGDPAVVNAATAQLVNDYRDYQAALTPEQLAKFGNLPDTSATSRMDQLRSAILSAPFQLNPLARDWDAAYDQARESTERTAALISTELSAVAAAAAQRASNLAGINSVILMLGLLIGITIAVLVARSLIRSLRLLRSSALDVAERRLPQAVESMRAGEAPDVTVEPVPIGTRDEVGQVARAFDAVHGQAVRLAAEQAALQANVSAMFINLSRRSQALVERQLQLIEALESNEQDADQLSNLFQLDHLATRMRRNSENLLVLAGTDLAKRNMAPVPVVDVLRAAVSEVEQYQRVVVQAPPTASIAGRAGSDLVHLLAELLDNATAFSPPESQVVMSTTRSPDGAIVIEIADRGVGMADDELADANMRLGGSASVDVSASRRMGLFVVGRLAARHGVGVRLSSAAAGPGSGVTASVSVPPSLIPTGVPANAPRPVGVPMPAGVPAQGGRSPEARPQRPNGARPSSLSALATGADAAGSAPPPTRDTSAASGGQSTLFAGKPPVNGTTAHGLPSRRPGSSLRPEGPPPTEAPPGGFFEDGDRGEDGPSEDGRPPGEQARLDQEAAARRDRMVGAADLSAVPPLTDHPPQSRGDERSVSDDERSPLDKGSTDGPQLAEDFADPGEQPFDVLGPEGPQEIHPAGRGGLPGPTGLADPPSDAPTRGTAPGRGTSGPSAFARSGGTTGTGRDGETESEDGRPDDGRPDTSRPDTSRPDSSRPVAAEAGAAAGHNSTDGRDPADGRDPLGDRDSTDRRDPAAGAAGRPDGLLGLAAAGFATAGAAAAAGALAGRQEATADPDTPTDADPAAGPGIPSGDARPGAGAPAERPTPGERPAPGGAPGTPTDGPGTTAGPATTSVGGPGTPGRGPGGAAADVQTTSGHDPARGTGAPAAARSAGPRPADPSPYAARAFTDTPGDDTDTPTTGVSTDPLPRRVAGPPSPAGSTPWPGGPSQSGQFRTDQQARPPEQYRSGSTGGFPSALPPGASLAPSRVPTPPPTPTDELFAPRVPTLDPDGQLPGHDPNSSAFDLGETTPIFEEIASAWFRSNRPVPVSWETDTGSHPTVPPTTAASDDTDPNGIARQDAPTPSESRASSTAAGDGWGQDVGRSPVGTPADGWPSIGRSTPGPADVLADAGADTPPSPRPHTQATAHQAAPTVPSPAPAAVPPTAMPPGIPAARTTFDPPEPRVPEPTPADFSTEADEGWLAANEAVTEPPDELTAAGLPKRRPRARLIPGSAGSAVLAPAVTAARSAENIRGRLASYQQGVRQGRETRLRGPGSDQPASPAAPGADHDEESP